MASDDKTSPESMDAEEAIQEEQDVETVAEDDSGLEPSEEQEVDESQEITLDELEEIREQLEAAKKDAEDNWAAVLSAKAEMENTRRRLERDVENAHKYAMERFVQELLPVVDSLEMGFVAASSEGADLASVREGTELTLKMFFDAVKKFGVEAIDPIGEGFDPEFHQAMSIQETDDEKPNTVMAVMQKGYLLQGRLIRPAMVVVSKAKSASSGAVDDDAETVGTNIDEQA